MDQLFVAAGIALVVGLASLLVRSRRRVDPPTQRRYSVPTQIDRADFGSPNEEWLIVVFTSSTCSVCADVAAKVEALRSRNVATRTVEFGSDRVLHERYGIEAVPAVVIADAQGVVKHHHLGPVTAAELWASVAAVRNGEDPVRGCCPET